MGYYKIIGIDPGERTGYAVFEKGEFSHCGTCSVADLLYDRIGFIHSRYSTSTLVVIEKPVVYPRSKVDPNSLISLAIETGKLELWAAYHAYEVLEALPAEWKGQVPKRIHNARILKRLGRIDHKPDNHAIDAIGLALWYLDGRKRS